MLWVIILHEYKSFNHKSRSRWECVILLHAVIAGLIQFAFHQVQIPDFAMGKSPHNIIEPPLCLTVSVIQEG